VTGAALGMGPGDVVGATEQDSVMLLRLAKGNLNAMSIQFCETPAAHFAAAISPVPVVILTGTGGTA
jgi:hypothetical protein